MIEDKMIIGLFSVEKMVIRVATLKSFSKFPIYSLTFDCFSRPFLKANNIAISMHPHWKILELIFMLADLID